MILYIDIPIIISPIPLDRADVMPGSLVLLQIGKQEIDGSPRFYYAAHPPLRLLVVNRSGIDITTLFGASVNAVVGWDSGDGPHTLPENAGKQHSKITIFNELAGPASPQTSLADMLAAVPRSDRPGGGRPGAGRPQLGAQPTKPYSITISPNLADWLIRLGAGNLSAGVRKASESAGYEETAT